MEGRRERKEGRGGEGRGGEGEGGGGGRKGGSELQTADVKTRPEPLQTFLQRGQRQATYPTINSCLLHVPCWTVC